MKLVTFDTPEKELAREEERKFIEVTAPELGKPPQDLKVVCYPYTSPTKAREITDVLDPSGIRRENIIGVERDKVRWGHLETQHLGVDLLGHPTQAIDFYSRYDGKLDLSLNDFQGGFSDEVVGILRVIAGRQLLSPKSILLLNVFGARELPQVKTHYGLADTNVFDDEQFLNWLESKNPERAKKFSPSLLFEPDPTYFNLYTQFRRDVGITRWVLRILMKGTGNLYIPPIYLRNPEFERLNRDYHEGFLQASKTQGSVDSDIFERALSGEVYFVDERGSKIFLNELFGNRKITHRGLGRGKIPIDFTAWEEYLKDNYCFVFDENRFYQMHNASLARQIKQSGVDPSVMGFLRLYSDRPYFLKNSRRVKYGNNMHLDMYSLTQHEDVLEDVYRHFDISQKDGALRFGISEMGYKRLGEALEFLEKEIERSSFVNPIPREELHKR